MQYERPTLPTLCITGKLERLPSCASLFPVSEGRHERVLFSAFYFVKFTLGMLNRKLGVWLVCISLVYVRVPCTSIYQLPTYLARFNMGF